MSHHAFLASLNLGTLVIVALIIAISLALFLRRRSNRNPMAGRQERNVAKDIDAGKQPPEHSRPKNRN